MSMVDNHIAFVNEQVAFQEKLVEQLKSFPAKQKFHKALLERFIALRNHLIEQGNISSPSLPSLPKQLRLSLTPTDLEGLPEELLKQLSISDGDKTDFAILNIIEEAGGIATLDQILIALFKKTGEIMKRQALTSRLYRIGQKDTKLIWSVPSKKGVYSNREISENEAAKLFGEEAGSA